MDPSVKPDPDNFDNLPQPPLVPPNVTIKTSDESGPKTSKPKRTPMARLGIGKKGNSVPPLKNHFKDSVRNIDDYFYTTVLVIIIFTPDIRHC